MKEKIKQAQKYLAERGLDGWLLYDFHRNNPLASQFLEIPTDQMTTRRFFYWVPVSGEPVKIVHAIESHSLDQCPGKKRIYLSWQSLETELGTILKGKNRVAMEYSPKNTIPYISKVDAGTVDLIRSFGPEVVSSADFLAEFTAVLDEEQIESQKRAAKVLDSIVNDTWDWISKHLKHGESTTEYDVQQKILKDFEYVNLITEGSPIVGVNQHSADPHYIPSKSDSSPIKKGDFILIDLWAKEKGKRTIFGDICRVGVAASRPTDRQQEIFQIVRDAQKAAILLIKERFAQKRRIEGWEVDDAARKFIQRAGFGDSFIHRTGHSIEIDLHGSGAHMDNLEMHDVRPILVGSCFSVEPGIYLPDEFGVRLECDVIIHNNGTIEITGGEQDQIVCLLS